MACLPAAALQGVSYDCSVPTGGLKEVYIAYRQGDDSNGALGLDMMTGWSISSTLDSTYGQITVTALAEVGTPSTTGLLFKELEFNTKDGVSLFNDVVTVNADGTKEAVPTILVEFPLMSQANVTAMEILSQGGVELVAAVRTAADTFHLVGYDFGLFAGTIDGTSGASRTDKNRIQLTLTGSEPQMAYTFASESDFNDFVTFTF